jgi:hypothetical protein
MTPKSLKPILSEVLMLGFDEAPPYDYIIDKIKKEILKIEKVAAEMVPVQHCFEWTIS